MLLVLTNIALQCILYCYGKSIVLCPYVTFAMCAKIGIDTAVINSLFYLVSEKLVWSVCVMRHSCLP